MEMYALANGLTIWSNSNLRSNKMDQSEFRFETIRAWYAEFKKNNGQPLLSHMVSIIFPRSACNCEKG